MKIRTVVVLFLIFTLVACGSTGGKKSNYKSSNRTELVSQVKPGSPEMINVELGVGYVKRGKEGDLNIALEKFKKAVKINPKFALGHSMLAHVYDRKALFDDAEKHYRLSMKYNNDSPNIVNNYANFLCQRKKFLEATTLYLSIVDDPQYKTPATAYENAGICTKHSGDLLGAEKHFRSALNLNSTLPNSLYNLMNIYLERSNFMKARAFLQRLEQSVALSPEILAAGYKIENALNHKDLANIYYSKLKKNFPNSESYKKLK